MSNQHDHVRAHHTCVRCEGPKDRGLLLCWPCHHAEKHHNDGSYSREVEDKIAALEARLSGVGQTDATG